jgi:hypothetical protein
LAVYQHISVPVGGISAYQRIRREGEKIVFPLISCLLIRFPLILWSPDMLFKQNSRISAYQRTRWENIRIPAYQEEYEKNGLFADSLRC